MLDVLGCQITVGFNNGYIVDLVYSRTTLYFICNSRILATVAFISLVLF